MNQNFGHGEKQLFPLPSSQLFSDAGSRIDGASRHGSGQSRPCRIAKKPKPIAAEWAFCAFMGGRAMSTPNNSPNSAEILAQLSATKEGVNLIFWFRLDLATALVKVLVSAVMMLIC